MSIGTAGEVDCLGSVEWLRRTGGRLGTRDRIVMICGIASAIAEGCSIWVRGGSSHPTGEEDALFQVPKTPIVQAAEEYLAANACPAMVNHCYRTAIWGLKVLQREGSLSREVVETTWVAALLHDIGLERPEGDGDFSMGGLLVLERLASKYGWDEVRTREAGQAIVSNLSTRVDPAKLGTVAWAMNAGGLGELGFPLHRAAMSKASIAKLEELYPREDFRPRALELIREEARRVPAGRFALLGPLFWVILRR